MLLNAAQEGMNVLGVLKDVGGDNDVSFWHINIFTPISINKFNTSLLIASLDAFTCIYIDQA